MGSLRMTRRESVMDSKVRAEPEEEESISGVDVNLMVAFSQFRYYMSDDQYKALLKLIEHDISESFRIAMKA
jgi:hypothetical protein